MRHAFLNSMIASLIMVGGAFCCGQVEAQDQKNSDIVGQNTNTIDSVQIHVREGYRYISSYGIPHHAKGQPETIGVKPVSLAFRVVATPEKSKKIHPWGPGMIFGVALDGVPITTHVEGLWNGNKEWPELKRGADQYGGFIGEGRTYSYGGIPRALISKDLSHVGYAADGFPIFVSKGNKFKSSYRLIAGHRPVSPKGPGGGYDGRYTTDYNYIHGAGNLDRCNGVDVKGKYYIYILTQDFPYVPQCWRGEPDASFLNVVEEPSAISDGRSDSQGQQKNLRRLR